MNGVIQNAKYVYARTVKVNPIARHYENPGERPYIKYGCPVCVAVGNDHVSIYEKVKRCPLCGVALNWEREPEIGDEVVILVSSPRNGSETETFEKGDVCTVREIRMDGETNARLYGLCKNDSHGVEKLFYPADSFSILTEEEWEWVES